MNTEIVRKVAYQVGGKLSKNSPSILTAMAVGGLITTVILAVRATPKAIQKCDDEEVYFEKETGVLRRLTVIEMARLTWKEYIPTVVMAGATIGCIIGANSISARRAAVLASAYSLAETTMKEYQAKVVETMGKNKEQKVQDEIAQDKLNANPIEKNTVIITGKGDMLCYESYSGRYFQSDIETLRRIENMLNKKLLTEMYITLNDFYSEIGLEQVAMGGEIGWEVNHEMIDLMYSAKLTSDNRPCIVVHLHASPRDL